MRGKKGGKNKLRLRKKLQRENKKGEKAKAKERDGKKYLPIFPSWSTTRTLCKVSGYVYSIRNAVRG